MGHWQQFAEREDQHSDIPFSHEVAMNIDAKVGIACIFAALLVVFFGV